MGWEEEDVEGMGLHFIAEVSTITAQSALAGHNISLTIRCHSDDGQKVTVPAVFKKLGVLEVVATSKKKKTFFFVFCCVLACIYAQVDVYMWVHIRMCPLRDFLPLIIFNFLVMHVFAVGLALQALFPC